MRTKTGSTELDAWATALGAHNDNEAIAGIQRLQSRLDSATDDLRACLSQMPESARRAKLTDEVRSWLATGLQNVEESAHFLGRLKAGFERHERGES
ncbi:hypothetical protein SAMN05428985_10347 [Nocardioides sp. YR527]|uniref:hypothetical protein n=1 Tax=Nocardioides sp. YR527 TaxID=1881028 RepID=UPI000880B209|nr:hypothetical protein [Nocardioides sp. YR527]SDK21375.1 hypothetical protein SAMN05428985_10347 [Nocardioides sp. YR527]